MTDDELRKHFDLKPCPNKPRSFQIGKLTGEWQLAEDCWSTLHQGRLQTYYLSFKQIKDTGGIIAYSLVIGKLKVIWSKL